MKRMNRLLLWCCILCVFTGTTACRGQMESRSVSAVRTTADTDEDGKPVIHLWHIYGSDEDQSSEIFERLTKEAEEKFQVDIRVDTAENEGYKTKIKAAAAANELPDIFYTWGHEFLKPMVDTGKVLEISPYITDEFKGHLDDKMMAGLTYGNGTYGLPFDHSVAMVFYNMEMMDQYGLSIPRTWEEFTMVCQTFIDHGITPMPVGGNEPWTIAMYYDLLALREAGPQAVADAAANKTDYSNPGFLEAARKLKQLVDMGAFPADSDTALREEAEHLFLQGKAPIYLNGSWTSGRVYKETSKVAGKVRAAPFPITDSVNSTVYDFTGGSDSAFAVSSRTENPNLAVELTQFLALGAAVELYRSKSSDIPYNNIDTGQMELNPLMQEIHEYTDYAESFTIWWDNLLEGTKAARYLENLQLLFGDKITPEEFIDRMNNG